MSAFRSSAPLVPRSPWFWFGLLAFGAILRIGFFLPDRAFWLDEALLASNLAERSPAELLEVLDGEQAAPPGFLYAADVSASTFGGGERSHRFPALLASLWAFSVFLTFVLRVLPERSAALAAILFACSPALIQFASELKPYALDAFFTVLLLLLFERARSRIRWRGWLPLAIAGTIAPWFSFPSVFVLAGGGLVLGRIFWRDARRSRAIPGLVGGLWLASFAALWAVSAAEAAGQEAFAQYWQNAFLPIPPTEARDLGLLARAPFDLFGAGFETRYAHATGDFSPYLGALLLWLGALGALLCWREDPERLGFWLAPIAMAVLASAMDFYPFIGRFLLVFAPVVLLLVARGWSALQTGRRMAAIVLIGLSLLSTSQLFLRPQPAVQTRQAITALAQQMEAGDTLIVHSRSLAGFLYYSEHDARCALPEGVRVLQGPLAFEGTAGILEAARALEATGRVWFLYEGDWEAEHPTGVLGAALEQRAPRVETSFFEGSQIHRFDFSASD